MRRLLIIAGREYMSYVRTAGFWLSLALAPLGLVLGAGLPIFMDRAQQGAVVTVVDLTGQDYASRLRGRLDEEASDTAVRAMRVLALTTAGPDAAQAVRNAGRRGGEPAARAALAQVAPAAARNFKPPRPPYQLVAPPPGLPGEREAVNGSLRPYIAGDRKLPTGEALEGAVVLHRGPSGVAADVWTAELGTTPLEDSVRAALKDLLRADRLTGAGLSPDLLRQLDALEPEIRQLSPKAASGGEISARDRLPTVVGFTLGIGLFLVIFAGAGLLFNSVMEEKSSRVLEILAGSASTTEIMGGKILGVAALTATMMITWTALGALALIQGAPGMAADVGSVLTSRGLLLYFVLYAALGYVMYAAIFAGSAPSARARARRRPCSHR
jgi:ABC-2 type transport system permease protein